MQLLSWNNAGFLAFTASLGLVLMHSQREAPELCKGVFYKLNQVLMGGNPHILGARASMSDS